MEEKDFQVKQGDKITAVRGTDFDSAVEGSGIERESITGFRDVTGGNVAEDNLFEELEVSEPTTPPVSPTVITSDEAEEEPEVDEVAQDAEKIESLERQKRIKELEADLGIGEAPEAPELKDTLTKLRDEEGIPAIESELAEVNKNIAELEAAAREQLFDAEGKPQQLGALRGEQRRIAEDAQRKVDALVRKKQSIVDELNMKNSTINQLMQFTQQDFLNASAVYQQKFNQNMQFYNLINAEMSEEEKSAMSKWQVLADQYEQSGLTWDKLNPEQQEHLEGLAIRGGMPGLSQFLGAGQGEIKSVTSRTDASGNTYFDILRTKPDGSLEVESIFRGQGGGSGVDDDTNTPPRTIMTSTQEKTLSARGLDPAVSRAIETDIISGEDLETIRQDLRDLGLDPGLLDIFDQVVNIENLRFKAGVGPKSGSSVSDDGLSNEEFLKLLEEKS